MLFFQQTHVSLQFSSTGLLSLKWMFLPLENAEKERIQDGDWGTNADSVSSMNQGPCWDTGAMLGRGEAPGRVETFAPWTPRPWTASPCYDTLREQAGHNPHADTHAGCWLQMSLGDLQQTKQVSAKHHVISLSHPWDKPAQTPWTDWSPRKKTKTKTEQ
jgi:hypothetical protein